MGKVLIPLNRVVLLNLDSIAIYATIMEKGLNPLESGRVVKLNVYGDNDNYKPFVLIPSNRVVLLNLQGSNLHSTEVDKS